MEARLATRTLLLGRGGRWPFAGQFHGSVDGAGVRVQWVGRVSTGGLDTDFLLARRVVATLSQGGSPGLDRRRAIAAMWDRFLSLGASVAEARPVLLLVAEDGEGAAISGIGLDGLFAVHHGCLAESWVAQPHPLLGAPAMPAARPGALTVESAPPYLVAIGADSSSSADPRGHRAVDLLPLCGVSA